MAGIFTDYVQKSIPVSRSNHRLVQSVQQRASRYESVVTHSNIGLQNT